MVYLTQLNWGTDIRPPKPEEVFSEEKLWETKKPSYAKAYVVLSVSVRASYQKKGSLPTALRMSPAGIEPATP